MMLYNPDVMRNDTALKLAYPEKCRQNTTLVLMIIRYHDWDLTPPENVMM